MFACMACSTVFSVDLCLFIIAAFVIQFQSTDRAVLHAATAPQTFILIYYRVFAAGGADVEKFLEQVLFL